MPLVLWVMAEASHSTAHQVAACLLLTKIEYNIIPQSSTFLFEFIVSVLYSTDFNDSAIFIFSSFADIMRFTRKLNTNVSTMLYT